MDGHPGPQGLDRIPLTGRLTVNQAHQSESNAAVAASECRRRQRTPAARDLAESLNLAENRP
jgi:hypothetical protein